MGDNEILNEKLSNTIQITKALIVFLHSVDLTGWAERYEQMLGALKQEEPLTAIKLRKSFAYGGAGSLSDIWLEDDLRVRFDKLVGAQSRTMANLRLFLEYGANRPLVVIDEDGNS